MNLVLGATIISLIIITLESAGLEHMFVKYSAFFKKSEYYKRCFFPIAPIWFFVNILLHYTPPIMVWGFLIFASIVLIRSYSLTHNAELYEMNCYFDISGEGPRDLRENFCGSCSNRSYICAACVYKEEEKVRLQGQALRDFLETLSPQGRTMFYEDRKREQEKKREEDEQRRKEAEEKKRQEEEEKREAERWARIFRYAFNSYNSGQSQ